MLSNYAVLFSITDLRCQAALSNQGVILDFVLVLRLQQFLLGRGGETVKLIAEKAKQSLMNTFRREMTLFLNVCMPGDQQQR